MVSQAYETHIIVLGVHPLPFSHQVFNKIIHSNSPSGDGQVEK
jgi:hypothetical protein